TGKVAGSEITGKADFGGFAEGDWSAKKSEAVTAAAAAPAPAAAAATPAPANGPTATRITGQSDVTLETQTGHTRGRAKSTENWGKITGTLSGPQGDVDVAGTFDGSALKLEFVAKTPNGDIPITMTGDVTGDSAAGKAEFGGFGQGE